MTDGSSGGGPDLVIRSARVLTPSGLVPALVTITNGKISAIGPPDTTTAGGTVVELAADEALLPGLVDTHVHVNEPGRTEWEGFATATAAAAAGGITTIVDMPLNSLPPTTDADALAQKRAAAGGRCHVDVAFWAGAVPGNETARRGLHEAGALGFKSFTVDSGVPEFPPLDPAGMERAARQLADLDSLLLVHAEDPACISAAAGRDYASFLRSRPDDAETRAVAGAVEIARRTGVRLHILHVSSAAVLPLIDAARADGVHVTAETCPHYLALAAEDVPPGATQFKCCPPIRGRANRELLWDGLQAGTLDCVVSDHSPCPPELKRLGEGDFGAAWGGIASLQLALPVIWTQARERGFTLAELVGWMAAVPASIAGLPGKGSIEVGRDADLIVFAPDASFTVSPEMIVHRHKLTPYAGQRLTGVVRRTWLRGRSVYPDGPEVPGRSATDQAGGFGMTADPDFLGLPDLASRRLGGSVVAANDELFAEKENLIKPDAPVFATGDYGPRGKVYDGWETRRRRSPGHDFAIVRLGVPGIVHGVVADTAFFRGNYPPEVSVEAVHASGYPAPAELDALDWQPLVPRSAARGDNPNHFPVASRKRWTHVRLSIYPDGGVARLRIHGEPVPDPAFLTGTVDLAALENGGRLVDCSDSFYSSAGNLIMPGRANSMADGWENARRRDGGHDYATFALAAAGRVQQAELDTSYFVGNAPGWARLLGAAGATSDLGAEAWFELLPRTRLQPDTRHRFLVASAESVTHVRLEVFPDGGMARLRVLGEITPSGLSLVQERYRASVG